MLQILEQILQSYDDLIAERLSTATTNPPSIARKGLGRHVRKGDPKSRFCHGRRVRKRGYRNRPRVISTVFGKLSLPLRVVECAACGARYSPLLNALKIEPYGRKEANFEHEVIEAVIDTNYRRLIEGHSIDISLGGIHNLVVGSDIEQLEQATVEVDQLSAIMADGTEFTGTPFIFIYLQMIINMPYTHPATSGNRGHSTIYRDILYSPGQAKYLNL